MNSGKFNLAKSYSEVLNEFYMNPYSMLKENENTLRCYSWAGWVSYLVLFDEINQLQLMNFAYLFNQSMRVS